MNSQQERAIPVTTYLTNRKPGSLDYEIAASALEVEFGPRTAALLLRRYRHRIVDLSVQTLTARGAHVSRLIVSTGFTVHPAEPW